MLRPENELDLFVRGLKKLESFKGVRFIHARKPIMPEKPVESFFVACSVGTVHKEKNTAGNRRFEAQLEFNIYAPYTKGARELGVLAVSLMDGLDRLDSEGKLSDIKISDPAYDKNLCTQYQKVEATLLWEIVPETPEELPLSSTMPITVNGVQVQAVSAVYQASEDVYVLRELLAGETDRYISKGKAYKLSITVESVRDPFRDMGTFDISYALAGTVRSFAGCRVTKITESRNSDNVPVREYEFFTRQSDFREESGEQNE
ncbi:MAG: hypothetical protein IJ298_06285 [Ruminococcus sp.]|nr:hypothetical protein [Ruminococcus sp.]